MIAPLEVECLLVGGYNSGKLHEIFGLGKMIKVRSFSKYRSNCERKMLGFWGLNLRVVGF
jgi:hypothetical protein